MYKNFILECILVKGKEGSGSTGRLHAKVGDPKRLPPCLFPVIYYWVSPPWDRPSDSGCKPKFVPGKVIIVKISMMGDLLQFIYYCITVLITSNSFELHQYTAIHVNKWCDWLFPFHMHHLMILIKTVIWMGRGIIQHTVNGREYKKSYLRVPLFLVFLSIVSIFPLFASSI